MRDIDEQVAVKQGQWFYGGLTTCPVRIVHHPTRLGSHDPEDPPELAADTQAGVLLHPLSPARPPRPVAGRRHGWELAGGHVFGATQAGACPAVGRLNRVSEAPCIGTFAQLGL